MSEKILPLFDELPPEAQRQALEFMLFLKRRFGKTRRAARGELRREKFIGLWRGRQEMVPSNDWTRQTRPFAVKEQGYLMAQKAFSTKSL